MMLRRRRIRLLVCLAIGCKAVIMGVVGVGVGMEWVVGVKGEIMICRKFRGLGYLKFMPIVCSRLLNSGIDLCQLLKNY